MANVEAKEDENAIIDKILKNKSQLAIGFKWNKKLVITIQIMKNKTGLCDFLLHIALLFTTKCFHISWKYTQ